MQTYDWLIPAILWLPCVTGFAIATGRYERMLKDESVTLFGAFIAGCGTVLLIAPIFLLAYPEMQYLPNLFSLSFFFTLSLAVLVQSAILWASAYFHIRRNSRLEKRKSVEKASTSN